MGRDHRKLRVFHDAHTLVLGIYRQTRDFPRDEWFGIRAQMRRAAVSIPSNLVEGNARQSTRDYLKFLYISLGSACELLYLTKLTEDLGYANGPGWNEIRRLADAVVRQIDRLTQTMEVLATAENNRRSRLRPETRDQRPETRDRRPETVAQGPKTKPGRPFRV